MATVVAPHPLPEGEAPGYESRPELALAALMYLMTRFPERRTPALAFSVVAHLRRVEEDERLAPELRDCAARLVDDWRAYAMLTGDEASSLTGRAPS